MNSKIKFHLPKAIIKHKLMSIEINTWCCVQGPHDSIQLTTKQRSLLFHHFPFFFKSYLIFLCIFNVTKY
jgi:hypothetical protein